MIAYLFSPPGLYFLIGFIILLSLIVYWQREKIKQEIRRWRTKEVSVGPLKLERKDKKDKKTEARTTGVHFGKNNDFSGAKVKRIVGRDIRKGAFAAAADDGATPGVDFGEKNKYGNAQIEDIAGQDIESEE